MQTPPDRYLMVFLRGGGNYTLQMDQEYTIRQGVLDSINGVDSLLLVWSVEGNAINIRASAIDDFYISTPENREAWDEFVNARQKENASREKPDWMD